MNGLMHTESSSHFHLVMYNLTVLQFCVHLMDFPAYHVNQSTSSYTTCSHDGLELQGEERCAHDLYSPPYNLNNGVILCSDGGIFRKHDLLAVIHSCDRSQAYAGHAALSDEGYFNREESTGVVATY